MKDKNYSGLFSNDDLLLFFQEVPPIYSKMYSFLFLDMECLWTENGKGTLQGVN